MCTVFPVMYPWPICWTVCGPDPLTPSTTPAPHEPKPVAVRTVAPFANRWHHAPTDVAASGGASNSCENATVMVWPAAFTSAARSVR